jgi:hypothetical protein
MGRVPVPDNLPAEIDGRHRYGRQWHLHERPRKSLDFEKRVEKFAKHIAPPLADICALDSGARLSMVVHTEER